MTKTTYITLTAALFAVFTLSVILVFKIVSYPVFVLSLLTAFLCIPAIFAVLIIYLNYEKDDDRISREIKKLMNNKSFKLPVNKIGVASVDKKMKAYIERFRHYLSMLN